jgi:hypothetical protein
MRLPLEFPIVPSGELHFHPYKLAIVQELSERDFNARRNACEALLEHVPQEALVFFTDEAHFYVTGCVNKQNVGYQQPPRTPSEAFAFTTCHRLVCSLISWDYRPMVF